MKGTHILALAVAGLWATALAMGINGIDLMRSQHIAGWPSAGHVHFYVYLPAALLALVLLVWGLAIRWRLLKIPAIGFILLAFLAFPLFLLAFTGGV